MNARGGMEIIVALIGLSLGILTQEMYTIIIMVAIVTSVAAPPALKWSLSKVEFTRGEEERMEREKLLARLPLSREGAKLLVLSGGGPHADLAAHIAAGLASHHDASITVFRAMTPGTANTTAQFNEQFERIKAIARAVRRQQHSAAHRHGRNNLRGDRQRRPRAATMRFSRVPRSSTAMPH